jgi:hypothetical protein
MHLSGEVVDTVADYIAIFVLVFVPALLIYLFWMVHILPEKIAERKHHPQLPAIKTLCLLSLVFGGMLWPIAWIWAYSKPVVHKLAYGTDRIPHDEHDVVEPAEPADLAGDAAVKPASANDLAGAGAAPGRP